jgi:1,4-dihydroxy-2-naphthoate octaprenyltransferase
MKNWIEGARPRTLPAAIAPVAVGTAMANTKIEIVNLLLAATVGLALQIGVNYANDYSDGIRGTDTNRVGPKRLVASGAVPAKSVRAAAFFAFAIAAISGSYLSVRTNPYLILIGIFAIIAAWGYTGGKNPYGYKGLGEVFVFIFFGLVATIGSYYVQNPNLNVKIFLAATACGLTACSLLMINNIRDLANDAKIGKNTLAVKLGETSARAVYSGFLFFAVLITTPISWITLFALPLASSLSKEVSTKKGGELIATLGKTGRYQLLLALLIIIGAKI